MQAGIDPVRMAKASAGLINVATPAIAEHFARNVADPFPKDGWSWSIPLARIPTSFALTALRKELKASSNDKLRLAVLTEDLKTQLEAKGYDVRFEVLAHGDEYYYQQLFVSLKPKSE